MVFYSPLQFLFWYDRPHQFQGEPELDFFKHVSTVWDDTRVVGGEIGQYVAIARRRGDEWYVGTLNPASRCELEVPLTFLEPDRQYVAHVYSDGSPEGQEPTRVSVGRTPVDSQAVLPADMATNGGHAIRIVPQDNGEQ